MYTLEQWGAEILKDQEISYGGVYIIVFNVSAGKVQVQFCPTPNLNIPPNVLREQARNALL